MGSFGMLRHWPQVVYAFVLLLATIDIADKPYGYSSPNPNGRKLPKSPYVYKSPPPQRYAYKSPPPSRYVYKSPPPPPRYVYKTPPPSRYVYKTPPPSRYVYKTPPPSRYVYKSPLSSCYVYKSPPPSLYVYKSSPPPLRHKLPYLPKLSPYLYTYKSPLPPYVYKSQPPPSPSPASSSIYLQVTTFATKVPRVLVTCRSQQLEVEGDGNENVPLYYYIIDNIRIQFGREEFCLVTGLRFGVGNLADYDDPEKVIPFRRRVFPSYLDGEHITGNMVFKIIDDELFDRLHDDDAVSLCCLGILQLVLLGVEGKRRIPD
ncbi:phospholipase-like protein [Tanacetum coccineum]